MRQLWVLAAAVALVVHAVPWWLAPKAQTAGARAVPVKIRLVSRAAPPSVAPDPAVARDDAVKEAERALEVGAAKVQRARAARERAAHAAAAEPKEAAVERTGASASPSPSAGGLRQDQLFPGPEAAFDAGAKPPGGLGAGDAGPGFDVASRSVAKLTYLARDLAERVDVPRSLRRLSPFGIAHATLRRVDRKNHWKATSFAGDPYFRAVLYEALTRMIELGERSDGVASLAKSELEAIRVTLEYRTTSVVDVMAKPVAVIVDGDRFTLIVTHKTEASVAGAVMPIGDGKALLDLIGTVKLLQQHISKQSEKDVDLRRLRESRAYSKSLW